MIFTEHLIPSKKRPCLKKLEITMHCFGSQDLLPFLNNAGYILDKVLSFKATELYRRCTKPFTSKCSHAPPILLLTLTPVLNIAFTKTDSFSRAIVVHSMRIYGSFLDEERLHELRVFANPKIVESRKGGNRRKL